MLEVRSRPAAGAGRAPCAAIVCAIGTVALVGVGLSLTIALIAIRLGEQGYSARAIGFNTAAAGVSTLLSASFIPGLARRFGVRRLLIGAIAVCACCLGAMAFRDDYWLWLGLRAIFGAGLTVLFVLSEYWINAVAPPERRGAILGIYAAAVALGFAAGPLILALVGTAGPAPFLAAVFIFLAATPIAFQSGSAPPLEARAAASVLGFLFVAPVATLAGLLHGAIETAGFGLLPVFALRSGGSVEAGAWFVTLFALGAALLQLPMGALADRCDRRRILLGVAVGGLVGALVLAVLAPHGLAFAVLLTLWGGLVGSFYALALGYLGARYAGTELASVNAAFVMLYSAGMLAGPPIVGAGMDALGPSGFFLACAALVALYLALATQAGRMRPAKGARVAPP
ncbi:MFS transporter [Methylocella sp.]|uniref:MFS transporter n=1 Tax=Methylocella sp. TaxID=1978226 RepID=UPI0035B2B040